VLCHDDDRRAYSHPCVRSPETSTGDVARLRQLCVSLRQFKTYRAYVALTKTVCAVMWIFGFAAIRSGDRIEEGGMTDVTLYLFISGILILKTFPAPVPYILKGLTQDGKSHMRLLHLPPFPILRSSETR